MVEIPSQPGALWFEVVSRPTLDARGAIERIRLFHYPCEQLNAFSAEARAQGSAENELAQ
jgi:hypothetical protein